MDHNLAGGPIDDKLNKKNDAVSSCIGAIPGLDKDNPGAPKGTKSNANPGSDHCN